MPPPPPSLKNKLRSFAWAKGFIYLLSLFLLLWTCADSDEHTHPTSPTDTTSPMITNHHFAVAENVPIRHIIGRVEAGDNVGITYYSINNNPAFSINTNGQITTITQLDYDTVANYSLIVQVGDAAGNNAIATITIDITDVDAPPIVTTLVFSNIQNNSVNLNANLTELGTNSDGSSKVKEYGFLYSQHLSQPANLQLGKSGIEKIAGDGLTNVGNYNFAISELPPITTYYFRAFAVSDGGVSYGEVRSFTTTCYYQNQTFTLNGDTDGEQSNLLCGYSFHTYTVSLSHQRMYSLSLESVSNISTNVLVYEDTNTNPFYIKAGPFSSIAELNFEQRFNGISGGTRYMILPLASNTHQIVVSNNSNQNENYSLNLAEYLGADSSPVTRRLLTAPDVMGYYESTSDIRFFWVHLPANKRLQVRVDDYRAPGLTIVAFDTSSDELFQVTTTNSAVFSQAAATESKYVALSMRNSLGGTLQQTNFRLIFSFVDP